MELKQMLVKSEMSVEGKKKEKWCVCGGGEEERPELI